jgi:hypothetical protein
MLRGTRTQYLRRRQYIFVWVGIPFWFCFLAVFVALSTGWWRTFWEVVMPPTFILVTLLAIARLTDKQWYREQAHLQREMNRRGADATYMPGLYRTRAITFAKRLFGQRNSN